MPVHKFRSYGQFKRSLIKAHANLSPVAVRFDLVKINFAVRTLGCIFSQLQTVLSLELHFARNRPAYKGRL